MANKKISDYTEALSVADDDLFEISVDLGGGTYETRKVKSSNLSLGGGNTIYTADDALTSDRTVDLNGNFLKFIAESSTARVEIEHGSVSGGISMYQESNGISYINNGSSALYLGAGGFNSLVLNSNGTNKLAGDTQVGTGSIGGPSARLKIRGSNLSAGTNAFFVDNSGGQEAFRIENDRKTYSKQLTVTGLGSTNATTALLVQNSSSSEAFKILDDLAIIMANLPTSSAGLATGQLWNNSGVINIV